MIIKHFFLFLCLLVSCEISACTCAGVSLQEEYSQATIMVVGRIVGRKTVSLNLQEERPITYFKYKVRVKELYKGQRAKVITILTPKNGATCGVRFRLGGTYLISAVAYEKYGLFTNLCLRNISKKELKFKQEETALKQLTKKG